jgi:hypothetical protein
MSEPLKHHNELPNAFKQLLEDAEANAPAEHLARVEQDLHHKGNQFRLIGDVVDLFLPNIFRTLFGMIGDEKKDENAPKIPSRRKRALPDDDTSTGGRG